MRKVILVGILLAAFNSKAQVYRGTIDKYPIVFELAQDQYSNWQARYYYLSTKIDIPLYRDEEDTTMLCTQADDNNIREKFALEENGKRLVGKWMHKGKTLKVDLSQEFTVKDAYSFERFKNMNAYSRIKFENSKLEKTKEEKYDESTILTWYTEPVTKVMGFRIKSSTKIMDIEKVNAFLRNKHLTEVCNAVECVDGAPYGGEYSVEYRISYLDKQLMSVVWSCGYYCGGAHPDGGESAFTIDLTTLKELNLRDLYWLSTDAYKKVGNDYDMPGYNEIWQALLNKQYPGEYPTYEGEEIPGDGCVYTADVWSNATWYLTPTGLYLGSFFPRVARCCDTGGGDPFVSYKLLEKYRVKTNKYVFK